MKNDRNAFKAGLFIVGAIFLGVVMLIAIRGTGTLLNPTKSYTVAFALTENLGGLKVGDPVRVGGYDQGRVTAIRFVADDQAGHRFEAEFNLPATYAIKADAVVQIEQGLTGTANLNVTALGGAAAAAAAEGTKLDGVGSALAEFYAIAPEAKRLVADVRAKIGPAYAAYDRVMARADAALVTGNKAFVTGDEAMAQARDVFGDTKTDIRSTMANLRDATGTIKTRLPETLAKVDAFLDATTATVANAKGTLEDIRAAAANAKDTTGEAKSLLVRNRSRIDSMIAGLGSTATNLEGASVEIRRSPWRLLYQPKADELSNLNVFDSARQFAEGAQELNAAASAVRDALGDSTVKETELAEMMKKLDASFEKYKVVEGKLWDAVK
jgi:ABC-type transporter Mla subunit MlaD